MSNSKNPARELAWTLYVASIEEVVNHQYHEFSAGRSVAGIDLLAPTDDRIRVLASALDAAATTAREETVGLVLEPLVVALDAIDNSRSKHERMSALRHQLDEAYKSLHAVKDGLIAPPATEEG